MLASLTAHELAARYRSGAATPTQATSEYLARIERLDPQVGRDPFWKLPQRWRLSQPHDL